MGESHQVAHTRRRRGPLPEVRAAAAERALIYLAVTSSASVPRNPTRNLLSYRCRRYPFSGSPGRTERRGPTVRCSGGLPPAEPR